MPICRFLTARSINIWFISLYLYKIVRSPIDILLNIVFEKTDSDERNHTKQFRQSVAVNQNVKIGPGYFAIGFPRGQLLILIPVRGRLYRRPKSLIKDHLLIKRRRKVANLAKLPLVRSLWRNYSQLSLRRSEIESGCIVDVRSALTLGNEKKSKGEWNLGNAALAWPLASRRT